MLVCAGMCMRPTPQKRGLCKGHHSHISWTQVETGSAITWKVRDDASPRHAHNLSSSGPAYVKLFKGSTQNAHPLDPELRSCFAPRNVCLVLAVPGVRCVCVSQENHWPRCPRWFSARVIPCLLLTEKSMQAHAETRIARAPHHYARSDLLVLCGLFPACSRPLPSVSKLRSAR